MLEVNSLTRLKGYNIELHTDVGLGLAGFLILETPKVGVCFETDFWRTGVGIASNTLCVPSSAACCFPASTSSFACFSRIAGPNFSLTQFKGLR